MGIADAIFTGQMPFMPPNELKESTEGSEGRSGRVEKSRAKIYQSITLWNIKNVNQTYSWCMLVLTAEAQNGNWSERSGEESQNVEA